MSVEKKKLSLSADLARRGRRSRRGLAQGFGLNAELPTPLPWARTQGEAPQSRRRPRRLGLSCFRYSQAGILDSPQASKILTRRCATRVRATSPARRQTSDHRDRKRRGHADAQLRHRWNVNNNGMQALLRVVERLGEDDNQHNDQRREKEFADNRCPHELSDRVHGWFSTLIWGTSHLELKFVTLYAASLQAGGAAMANAMGRPTARLVLGDGERDYLERQVRRQRVARSMSERCRIILRCADGMPSKVVAAELGVHEHTVGKWRRRFLKDRVEGLLDEARPGPAGLGRSTTIRWPP